MGREEAHTISPERVERYLQTHGFADAKLESLTPLGGDTESGLKSYGYGRPLKAIFTSKGKRITRVFRTMSADPFGHGRRSDRFQSMVLCYDTFNDIPGHIHALDVGAFSEAGQLVSMAHGEPFLVTDFVEGDLYAKDLFALQGERKITPNDAARAEKLGEYLAELHSQKAPTEAYARHLRDLVGAGEGIFGQTESYAGHEKVATADTLRKLEDSANRWRWKLRAQAERCCRTHGDFHPFNILFRSGSDLSVLDCSRGAAGEPADDVTCLSVNYIFFSLVQHGAFVEPFSTLWGLFWDAYLRESGDQDVVKWVAPYFAWRCLVLASPIWYPDLDVKIRHTLLGFAQKLLDGETFDPYNVGGLLK